MQVAITCRHTEIDEATKERIHKKVDKLQRYFDRIKQVEVIIAEERLNKVAEVILFSDGPKIRACESNPEVITALDLAFAKTQRQLKRFKGRLIDMHRRPARRRMRATETVLAVADPMTDEEIDNIEEGTIVTPTGKIITTEHHELLDLTPEDAATHLELSGEPFFFFLNHENHQVNLLHRRSDGHFGLIVPQVD